MVTKLTNGKPAQSGAAGRIRSATPGAFPPPRAASSTAPPVYKPASTVLRKSAPYVLSPGAGVAPPVYRPSASIAQCKPISPAPASNGANSRGVFHAGLPARRISPVSFIVPVALPARVVQRIPVSLAIVESVQDHHPIYRFTTGIGGGAQQTDVDLDPWITRKGFGYEQKYVDKAQKRAIRALIAAWTCAGSIVKEFVKTLVGPPSEAGIYDYQDSRHSYVGADLARHLIAMQENIKLRERDIAVNCYNVTLTKTDRLRNVTTESKVIGWTTLLKEARAELKKAVLAGTKCPSAMGDVTLLSTAVQNTADLSVRELRRLGLLSDEMALDTSVRRVDNFAYEAASTGAGSFNFGYGHVRFILFLEWRICAELLLNQTVKG